MSEFKNPWEAGGSFYPSYLHNAAADDDGMVGDDDEKSKKKKKGLFHDVFRRFHLKGKSSFTSHDEDDNNTHTCVIESTIYLLPDDGMDVGTITDYYDYFVKNVTSHWDNIAFKTADGMDAVTRLELNVFIMSDEVSGDPRFVSVKRNIENGAALLIVQETVERSFIRPDRRSGVLYSKNSNADNHTAAHEFGHLLGLSDRYNYVHFIKSQELKVKYNDDGDNFKQVSYNGKTDSSIGSVDTFLSDSYSVPGYEPFKAGDADYGKNQAWRDNLMGTGHKLTSYQLELVCRMKSEGDYTQHSFFLPGDHEKNDKPDFVGLDGDTVIGAYRNANVTDMGSLNDQNNIDTSTPWFNPMIGHPSFSEDQFYTSENKVDDDELEKKEYNGALRSKLVRRAKKHSKKVQKIEERIKKAEDDFANVKFEDANSKNEDDKKAYREAFNIFKADLVKLTTPGYERAHPKKKYDHHGKGNTTGRNYWNKMLDKPYERVVRFQHIAQNNDDDGGKGDNAQNDTNYDKSYFFYIIRNLNFYYNRRAIINAYLMTS